MASDFAPVQPQYLNLGQILGQAEDIKSSRMQQQMYQQRMQGMQQEQERMGRLSGLYRGGRNPSPQELATVDPDYAQQADRLRIDNMNAENGRIGEIQKVTRDAAQSALKMWENTGRAPDAWPAILQETGRQLQSLGLRHPNGHLVGEEIDPNKVTPQMIMQIAGWEDPNIVNRRNAQAEAMKAGAKAGAEAPYDAAKFEREQAGKIQLENFKIENKPPPAPKPPSELDQQRLDDMRRKAAAEQSKAMAERDDAIANIDDTINEFERLKDLQAKTTTGPASGSAPVAFLRKMGPNSVTGGDDLALLEKGYNTLAVKAIGAFKAGGVTFGQLSNKEGEWVKSTQATINSSEPVNLDTLNEGLRLLQMRKDRILNQSKGIQQSEPANEPARPAQSGVRVRRSNRTGAVQHSTDGGVTWVNGEP
jgi:hypothetical protein